MNTSSLSAVVATARGVCVAVLISSLAAQVAPPPPSEPKTEGDPKLLEPFEVTGSRVKRLDYETPAPVVTYTAAVIEDKGYTTLGEFVQSLPFNSGTANSEFTTASFVTGAATINPRGLGSNRVLTLVNGRRGVPYALTNSAGGTPQTVFNFNSIPQSAIDRVEFLKDGASAIYGSDAITGVYNIILKKNYEGSAVDMYVSNTLDHDSLFKRINLFSGLSRNGWEVTASLSYQDRNDNFLRDFGVKTVDFRNLGPKGANQTSSITHPSYLSVTAAQAQAMGIGTAAGIYTVDPAGVSNPTRQSFTHSTAFPAASRFDFVDYTQIYPKSESYSGHVYITKNLTSSVTAFAQVLASRANTFYKLQPYGFTNTLIGLSIPPTNPYNPTGQTIANTATQTTLWSYRGTVMPERDVRATTASLVGGLRGDWNKRWNWEEGASYGVSKAIRTTEYIAAADLQRALSGTTRATAYNPFGPQEDPNFERNLFTRSKGLDNDLDSISVDAQLSGNLVRLPWRDGGEIGVATGYEHRYEHIEADPEPRNFLGFTATTPFKGSRDVDAAFLELSAPLQRWLEVQAAVRHERYSDFGDTTKPKFAGKIRLPANRFVNVIIRGSHSKSYKAPDLGQLYQPQSNATTSVAYLDPLRPQDTARQLRQIVGGNPNLKPEQGKVQYVGAIFETPRIRGLSFSIDYFDQKIHDQINSLGASYLLSREGMTKFPTAIVREEGPQPGRIVHLSSISNNLGFQLYRGFDYGMRYMLRNTRFGSFTFTSDAIQVIKRGSNSGQGGGFGDATGYYFAPEWRFNHSVSWRYKNFGGALVADIIGKYFNDRQSTATFDGWGENPYTILTPSFTYRGFKRTTITISSNNVLDNRPPPNGHLVLGFDDRTYGNGVLGRTVSLRVRREF